MKPFNLSWLPLPASPTAGHFFVDGPLIAPAPRSLRGPARGSEVSRHVVEPRGTNQRFSRRTDKSKHHPTKAASRSTESRMVAFALDDITSKLRTVQVTQKARLPTPRTKPGKQNEAKQSPAASKTQEIAVQTEQPVHLPPGNSRSPHVPVLNTNFLRKEIRPGDSTINPFMPCEPFPVAQGYVIRQNIPIAQETPRTYALAEGSSTIDPFSPCEPFDTSDYCLQVSPLHIQPSAILGALQTCTGSCYATGTHPWCPWHSSISRTSFSPVVPVTLASGQFLRR